MDNGNLNVYNVSKYGAEQHAYSLHIGDTWKMSSKLTLNYGLRWDQFSPTWETSDQLVVLSALRRTRAQATGPAAWPSRETNGGPPAPASAIPKILGTAVLRRASVSAYQLNDKTVVRAGYGVFYTQAFYPGWGGGMSLDGFNPQLSFGNSLSGYEPSFYMDNGFPAYSKAPNISRNRR